MSSDSNFDRHIVVSGLPANVTPDKHDKFMVMLRRKVAEHLGHESFNIQLLSDDSGLVYGAFITFATSSDAEAALARLNGYNLSRQDKLRTYPWSMLEEARDEDEEYVPPQLPDEEEEEQDFAHHMAEDPSGRPQFLVKGGEKYDVTWYWYDWEKKRKELFRKPAANKSDSLGKWSELDRRHDELEEGVVSSMAPAVRPLPVWSTYGTMIVSLHPDNTLRIWGGRAMHLLFEITQRVEAFMVSPCENFIVVKTLKELIVYNMRNARRIRSLENLDLHSDDLWPIARFSADDSLVAVCRSGFKPENPTVIQTGRMSIYTSETMVVVPGPEGAKGHTFAIEGLYKAEWSPVGSTQIAYMCVPAAGQGWRVVISNILVDKEENVATEEVLLQRNFLQAEKLDMLWHPAGTHLSVKVTLKRSVEYFMFHITRRDVSVFQLTMKQGYTPSRFAWQPGGDYFSLLLNKTEQTSKIQLGDTSVLQIFSINRNKLKMLKEMVSPATHLFWATQGPHLVATNPAKSILQFISVNENGSVVEQKRIADASLTECQWDPTGRYFATWVSSLRKTTLPSGYRIYSINGTKLLEETMRPFSHFAWRPLPPSMLATEEVSEIKGTIKKIVDEYESTQQEKGERERLALLKEKKDAEDMYVKKMNDAARKCRAEKLVEKRAELEESSIWSRFWATRLKAIPEDKRMRHEEVIEERMVFRRPVA